MWKLAATRVSQAAAATARRQVPRVAARAVAQRFMASEISDADFDAKWTAYFDNPQIEPVHVRRGLNDVFAHDLVPSAKVIESALRATRRVNDFPTSIRIFEGIADKAPTPDAYQQVVNQLKPVIDELHLTLPEELGL